MPGIGTGLTGAMMTAATGSLAGNGAVGLINNRGNLGATLNETLSADGLKSALIAAASAGVSNELDSVWGGNTDPATGRTISHDLNSWAETGLFAGQQASQALADAGLQSAISGGNLNDNLKQNLQGAVTTVLEASLFNLVGDLTKQGAKGSNGQHWADGSAEKTVVHALAGGLASQATGGDFRTGAIAAGANEALINQLDDLVKGGQKLLIAASQITGIVAAGMADGDVQKGAEIAGNATAYNRMMHTSEKEWIEAHGGSEEEKARLTAAACALIECSAQYERGSEQYALYKGLEDKGNTDAFAAERQKVMSSGLFGYSKWNGVTDGLERYQVGNRSFGALQIVGSGALAASAAAMASTGAGTVLAYVLTGIAADQGAAGAMAVWYGHPAPTFGARVLADQMNIPVERAELLYGLATAAGEASAANQLLNAASRSVSKKPMVEFDGFDDGINASKSSLGAASGGKVGTDSLDSTVKNGPKVTVSSSLKLGETKVINDVSMTRVGRWMSPDELVQMKNTNKVVQGGGGQTFISTNGVADFKGTAPKGSVYAEFDVPANSLLQGGKDGWFKMIGPSASKSQQFLLNKQGGEHLPGIKNIEILDRK